MARPEKRNAEYYPHLMSGTKMRYIRKKYGNDGYAAWHIMLEQLTNAENHYIICDEFGLTILADECMITCEGLTLIIEDLVKLGKFNAKLWTENRVLYSKDLRDSVSDAYRMRKNDCITTAEIISKFNVIANTAQETELTAQETTSNDKETTQSKVEYNRVEREIKKTHSLKNFKPANDSLAEVRELAKYEPIATTQMALYQVIVDRVLQDPDWWKQVTEFCNIKGLTRQQREDAIKAWAGFIITNGRTNEIRGLEKAEASLQNWLMRERQFKTK